MGNLISSQENTYRTDASQFKFIPSKPGIYIADREIQAFKRIICSGHELCVAELLIPKGATIIVPNDTTTTTTGYMVKCDGNSCTSIPQNSPKLARRFRTDKVKTVAITCKDRDGFVTEPAPKTSKTLFSDLKYTVGQSQQSKLNANIENPGGPGIYFFPTFQEAESVYK